MSSPLSSTQASFRNLTTRGSPVEADSTSDYALRKGIHIGESIRGPYMPHQTMDIDIKQELECSGGAAYLDLASSTCFPPGPNGMSQMCNGPLTNGTGPGRTRKNKEDKICGVCGDKALGYNFDAISCESCKAFFRRNAPKGLECFKCPYDEKCKMDISNRRFCKRCRLRKCFEIGMRKEYILTEEEKARKRQKIEENRPRGVDHKVLGGRPETKQSKIQKDQEKSVSPLALQPYTVPIQEFDRCSMEMVSSASQTPPILSSEDQEMIQELNDAYCGSLQIMMDRENSREAAQSMKDLVNIAEISIRRVIDMSKKISSFKALPQEDQINLLKGGSIELLILRSVITFDQDKQHFLDPLDNPEKSAMTIDQLRRSEGPELFEDHMRFVTSLAVDLHADQTMLILLLVVSLFSPDRPNVKDKDLISEEQEKYSELLQRYLESKLSPAVARARFPRLLMKLTDIRNLNEEHSQVLLKVNPDGIQPLMQEVLDLHA